MKGDFCAGLARFPCLLEFRSGLTFFVRLFPDGAVALNFEFEPIGKRVDDGDADAVETAGNFVRVAVKFSAGVENGENNFGGGALFGGVHVHGNAAAIVDDRDGIVFVHGDVDFIRVAGHRFVNRVVHNFPDEVMQAHFAGRADVHRGTQAHGFESAEHFDGFCIVLMSDRCFSASVFFVAHVSPSVRIRNNETLRVIRACAKQTANYRASLSPLIFS